MSIQTMLKFMNLGYIHYFEDIYTLKNHADEIRSLDGFGEKSCNNMLQAIEKSKNVDPVHFIYALCIPQIGTDAGKKMIAALGTGGFFQKLHAGEGFEDIDGIGPERSTSMLDWYRQNQNRHTVAALEEILNIAEEPVKDLPLSLPVMSISLKTVPNLKSMWRARTALLPAVFLRKQIIL